MADRFRQVQVLCGAILSGLVVVNAVLLVLVETGTLHPVAFPRPVLLVLFALGVALLAAAPAVKRAVFKRLEAEGFEGDREKFFAAWQMSCVVAFALREAAGLIGFLLSVLTVNVWWSWGLGGAAVTAMIFDWPKRGPLGG